MTPFDSIDVFKIFFPHEVFLFVTSFFCLYSFLLILSRRVPLWLAQARRFVVMYHSVLPLIKCKLCEARGNNLSKKRVRVARGLSTWVGGERWMHWSKVIWTVPRTFWQKTSERAGEWQRGSCGYQGNTWRMTTSVFFSFFSLHFQQLRTLHSQMRITFSSCTTVPSRYFKNSEKRRKWLTIQDQLCLFLSWWNKGTTTFMSKNLLSCFAIQENVELVMSIRIRSLFTQH